MNEIALAIGQAMDQPTRTDGRSARAAKTRTMLLTACRAYMQGGMFRPSMASICKMAGYSIRSGFQHFKDIETLHRAALDEATTRAILARLIGGRENDPMHSRVVRAAVFGRLP